MEGEAERAREHVREGGLADPGQVLDQQVAACEQAGEREADLALLAEDDPAGLIDDAVERRRHADRLRSLEHR